MCEVWVCAVQQRGIESLDWLAERGLKRLELDVDWEVQREKRASEKTYSA